MGWSHGAVTVVAVSIALAPTALADDGCGVPPGYSSERPQKASVNKSTITGGTQGTGSRRTSKEQDEILTDPRTGQAYKQWQSNGQPQPPRIQTPNIGSIRVPTPAVRAPAPRVVAPTVRAPAPVVRVPRVNTPSTITGSDVRLKRDIIELGQLSDGLRLYRFRYNWDETTYVGVMAQDVLAVDPGAVVRRADGYLGVDYGRLGLRLMTWEEWIARDPVHAH